MLQLHRYTFYVVGRNASLMLLHGSQHCDCQAEVLLAVKLYMYSSSFLLWSLSLTPLLCVLLCPHVSHTPQCACRLAEGQDMPFNGVVHLLVPVFAQKYGCSITPTLRDIEPAMSCLTMTDTKVAELLFKVLLKRSVYTSK